MDTNGHEAKLRHGDLVYAIVGCTREVLNRLGHGRNEKPCEIARTEPGLRTIPFDQQTRFDGIPNLQKARLEWERLIL